MTRRAPRMEPTFEPYLPRWLLVGGKKLVRGCDVKLDAENIMPPANSIIAVLGVFDVVAPEAMPSGQP